MIRNVPQEPNHDFRSPKSCPRKSRQVMVNTRGSSRGRGSKVSFRGGKLKIGDFIDRL